MKVAWTARARTRLAEIHDYIAQDSKPRALAMVERILDRAEVLMLAPRGGARLQAFVDDEVRELLERPYRIVYRVSATSIEIRSSLMIALKKHVAGSGLTHAQIAKVFGVTQPRVSAQI
jgi:plasmid stabilization system protein ParE